MTKRQRIVVVGHGMVGHRFAQAAVERGLTETHDVLVLGEEPRAAYDRVALTSWFAAGSDALSLLPGGEYDDPRVRLVLDSVVTEVDRAARTVTVTLRQVLWIAVAMVAARSAAMALSRWRALTRR